MSRAAKGMYIPMEKLAQFAENTARSFKLCGRVRGKSLSRALYGDLARIRRARERAAGGRGAAAEWLLDNWYLIEREGAGAARSIAGAGRLRAAGDGAVIYGCAWALTRSGLGEITEERISVFLTGFQRALPLERGELAAFTAALRAALVAYIAAQVPELEGQEAAAAVAAAVTSLRALSTLDLSGALEAADLTEAVLRQDPAGIYTQMDERTRDMYRREVTRLAKKSGIGEQKLARAVLELARKSSGEAAHVGHWLFVRPMGAEPRGDGCTGYVAANLLIGLFLSLLGGYFTRSFFTAALLLLPVSELVKSLLDMLVLRLAQPRLIPRLELPGGVPEDGLTVCAVSALLTSEKTGGELAARLEEYRLASRDCGENLLFALLADLPEAAERTVDTDNDRLESARAAVDALNRKYGGGFYLLCRRRSFSAPDGRWMGRERKRGAIMALAALMRGGGGELSVLSGDPARLTGARYILALDSDTRLLPGAARELIGAMLHPMNRPKIENGRVVSGYGVMHPRMVTELASAVMTRFSRCFAGEGGTDPYGSACGELWMDLTGRGGFSGKGIMDAQALLECCSSLPEGAVLSHDAIEGALLRGAYLSDTELSDTFPSTAGSYFKRLHRWTRGDWQNLRFISQRWALPEAERWRLLDSLRRSLFPLGGTAALFCAAVLPGVGPYLAALSALAALFSGALPEAAAALASRPDERGESLSARGFAGSLCRALLRLALLPWEAAVCTGAALTALWRMLVTGKNLLQWQTAAQSEGHGGGLWAHARAMWPECLLGAVTAALAGGAPGICLGALWLLSPALAEYLDGGQLTRERLSEDDKALLLELAGKIWRYFTEQCTPRGGYLPPDNWQEQPPLGAAMRTSPTNIGLALVSSLAAADLGLDAPERALALAGHILDTVERLPRWRGHLYNWYDIEKLESLRPEYVSTVDSGNLAASLAAFAAGAREYGREDLAARAEALASGMDFAALYDGRRRLFHIGCDVSAGHLSEGLYDLMSSEARLTGYYAVATGQVERRHWRRLSRAMVKYGGRRGMASWTGTMFEYLMPELFLPLEPGSLLWESARFCLFVQRRDVPRGLPWGESESAFYSLDSSLSYRYKAHGCAGLALKRGMGADTVVAPYASFLALCVSPREAVRNLRRLMELDMDGRYGLWEAMDFTASRCASGGGEQVRCVMAHHLGMSLVAAANCLLDGVMVRRFMSRCEMRAFAPLLSERTSLRAVTLRPGGAEPPAKPRRGGGDAWELSGAGSDAARPRVCLLSNGVYSVMLTSTGLSCATAGGIGVYRGAEDPLRGPAGLEIRLRGEDGREFDLLPVPGAAGGLGHSFTFRGDRAVLEARGAGLRSRCTAAVIAGGTAELRVIELSSESGFRGELVLEFEPMLARVEDYVNHPAFWRLGMHALLAGDALLLSRLPRAGTGACCLCALADRAGTWRANEGGEALGWLNHPRAEFRVPVSLGAGGSWALKFTIAWGAEAEGTLMTARQALCAPPEAFADLLTAKAALDGLDSRGVAAAMELAAALAFPRAGMERRGGREELWRHGVSGDDPIICARFTDLGCRRAAGELIRQHSLLRACGLRSDLVFLTADGGDYLRGLSRSVSELLSECSLEALSGARGGVHTADISAEELLRAAAVEVDLSHPQEGGARRPPQAPFPDFPPLPRRRRGAYPDCEWLPDGSFAFNTRGSLPPRAWTHVLANGGMGFLAADSGLGCMWHGNARERRINTWICDEKAVSGPETLEMEVGGRRLSLFADEDGVDCRVTFGFGFARWEKCGAAVTALAPPGEDARLLIVENASGTLYWKTDLTLSESERDSRYVVTSCAEGLMSAASPCWEGAGVSAAFSQAPREWTCDRAAWLAGSPAHEQGAGLLPCFAAAFQARTLVIAVSPDASLASELSRVERARAELERTVEHWRAVTGRLRVHTPDAALDRFMNGWAVYQALCCRLLGRTGQYQSGGAFGFRDQLQDAVNLILIDPSLARSRILDCCARQYEEGDVMHWWHPRGNGARGVRTRCSDDYLWLPWAVAEYVQRTGNRAILGEKTAFLRSDVLGEDERSRYEQPPSTEERCTVLEHCRRAFALYGRRGTGAHGLPLMLDGDWNDGMDAVGRAGRGESVWLAWFHAHTAREFAGVLEEEGLAAEAEKLRRSAGESARAADAAWDGGWYLRGYYDSGAPLGGAGAKGCEIDSIAQSWAAICREAPPERRKAALDAALSRLFDPERPLARLFEPPFCAEGERAGYIRSYGPGFRENGGQYTHAAIWLALACFREGRAEEGLALLRCALPRQDGAYGAEPFVIPADVCAAPERYGEAGWNWYTGSAGWFFRTAAEELLGLRLRGGKLSFSPRLPESWDGFEAEWTDGSGQVHRLSADRGGSTVES